MACRLIVLYCPFSDRTPKIAMANWTPEGITGHIFRLSDRYLPVSAGIPSPVLWGDEGVVRRRLGTHGVHVQTVRRTFIYELPFPPARGRPHISRILWTYEDCFLDVGSPQVRPRMPKTSKGYGLNTIKTRMERPYWNATVTPDGTGRIPVAVIAQTIVLATTPARSINYVCISIRPCEVQLRSGRLESCLRRARQPTRQGHEPCPASKCSPQPRLPPSIWPHTPLLHHAEDRDPR